MKEEQTLLENQALETEILRRKISVSKSINQRRIFETEFGTDLRQNLRQICDGFATKFILSQICL